MIADDFLANLPRDPLAATHAVCAAFRSFDARARGKVDAARHADYLEWLALLHAVTEGLALECRPPGVDGSPEETIVQMREFARTAYEVTKEQLAVLAFERSRERYRARLGKLFAYEFTDGDLARVQGLINELREELTASTCFEEEHRQRLLKRLEALQADLHKRMPTLDRIWGLVGDAGVALGKFGTDAKPFVDRIREMAQIAWRTQARAEELPSGCPLPLLAPPDDEEPDQP